MNKNKELMKTNGITFVLLTAIFLTMLVSCKREVFTGITESPAPQNGRIFIDSNPKGAMIYLNGKNSGLITPDTLKWLNFGRYDITLKLYLYNDTKIPGYIVSGTALQKIYNDYSIQPDQKGSIICSSQPNSAKIFLNNVYINQKTPYTIANLTPGYYWVKFSYPLCRMDSIKTTVIASAAAAVSITLDDTSRWVSYAAFNSAITSNYLSTVVVDNNNIKWIASQGNGLNRFDGINWEKFTTANSSLHTNAINCLGVDSKNNLWIGSANGLMTFDGKIWTDYSKNVNNSNVTAVKIDKTGNVWVATSSGLYQYNGTSWKNYTPSNSSIAATSLVSLDIAPDGKIWIGTNAFGINVFDGISNWQVWNSSNIKVGSTVGNIVGPIVADRNGVIWAAFYPNAKLGYDGGLCKYEGNQWSLVSLDAITTLDIQNIYVDSYNTKWICTQSAGLGKYTASGSLSVYHKYNTGLLSDFIKGVCMDTNGDLWIATYGGGAEKFKKGNF
jgi:ligand-binding sensor domain-containing protein